MKVIKILDLCCGGGGSAIGLRLALPNCKIVGIDINEQPDYPFTFVQKDITKLSIDYIKRFDLVWASVPCQRYSIGGNVNSRKRYPDLINVVREMLLRANVSYIMENVPRAPLRKDLMLCGEMFGLKVIRHRIFEIRGFKCEQPPKVCNRHKGKVVSGEYIMVCRGGRPGCYGDKEKRNKLKAPTLEKSSKAMGIYHISKFNTIVEAIPPSYSKYIMECYLKSIGLK